MELRHDLRLPIECTVHFADKGEKLLGEGTILNLSTGGWQIASPQAVSRGAPLVLRVSLPDGGDPMEVELVTVRWTVGDKFGLKNVILGEREWKRLRRFVVEHVQKTDLSGSRAS